MNEVLRRIFEEEQQAFQHESQREIIRLPCTFCMQCFVGIFPDGDGRDFKRTGSNHIIHLCIELLTAFGALEKGKGAFPPFRISRECSTIP
jgi:hypothetical protein